MVRVAIGDISFQLKQPFDFSFLKGYDSIFRVFDMQDSGNLCFGASKAGRRYFLKLAGAATVRSLVTGEEAVRRLISTIPVYEALRHPLLINIMEHRPVKGGYLAVFDWFNGVCMGKQYGSFHKFIALPHEEKMTIYREIMTFHSHVNRQRYVAVDFYDGCILYDFNRKITRFCDIEMYAKMPYANPMGRMWGSDRYMSPEEFRLGAEIDEQTNVFLMGACAFQLFGGGLDRSAEKWAGGPGRYRVALKAVNADKKDRYGSIPEYVEAWDSAG